MKQLTDITVVLDRSGSMGTIKTDMEGGFDAFVKEQRESPGDAVLSLVQFDTEYELVYAGRDLKDVPPLTLVPRGMTALRDALGRAIQDTGLRLARLPESERPDQVIIVVLSDGLENASRHFTAQRLREMVQHQTDVYKWSFTFIGANQDAVLTGDEMGIPASASLNYAASSAGTASAMQTMSGMLRSRKSSNDALLRSAPIAYTPEEREESEKWVTTPK